MNLKFFPRPSHFRKWLEKNHSSQTELWVGYYKKGTKIPSITWPESVDEALCFGWIDGIRKSIDEVSYKIRFTPRKPRSHWSKINIERVKALSKLGRMTPAGLQAFGRRKEEKSGQASYEQKKVALDSYLAQLRSSGKAWEFFQAMPLSYRKQVIRWIMSAKRPETRQKRTQVLIESCQLGELIPPMRWSSQNPKSKSSKDSIS